MNETKRRMKGKMSKIRCKLCGKVLPNRSVKDFMEHLEQEHNAEFVDKVEAIFFEDAELNDGRITKSMLICFSEVSPLASLLDGKRYYEGMNDFDAYQVNGKTHFRNRQTKEAFKLTAIIESIGKTEVIRGKDFTDLEKTAEP